MFKSKNNTSLKYIVKNLAKLAIKIGCPPVNPLREYQKLNSFKTPEQYGKNEINVGKQR